MKYGNLREYFAATRGNQIALARQLGCGQSTLSLLANGRRRPSPRLAARLEKITGIPLRTLLGLDSVENDVRPGNAQQG